MAKGKKTASKNEPLAKELRSLIPKLDEEGLAFLVEQARIHLYNMQVTELNKTALSIKSASSRKNTIVKKAEQKADNKMRIEATQSGSSYYLYFRNKSIMFSKDEMITLVKMTGAKDSDLEIRERLYNWFERERRDIFAVIPIADKFDERLKNLLNLLKKNFKLRS
ncbi:MAG: hypothetical protein FWG77_06290 [Treponema sp.]|nr:hypothetical protein [Treponema sp.]